MRLLVECCALVFLCGIGLQASAGEHAHPLDALEDLEDLVKELSDPRQQAVRAQTAPDVMSRAVQILGHHDQVVVQLLKLSRLDSYAQWVNIAVRRLDRRSALLLLGAIGRPTDFRELQSVCGNARDLDHSQIRTVCIGTLARVGRGAAAAYVLEAARSDGATERGLAFSALGCVESAPVLRDIASLDARLQSERELKNRSIERLRDPAKMASARNLCDRAVPVGASILEALARSCAGRGSSVCADVSAETARRASFPVQRKAAPQKP